MASVTSTSISSWASSRSPSRRNCGSLPCSSLRSRSKSAILKLVIVVVLPSVDSATHLEPHGGPFCQRARNLHHYLLLNWLWRGKVLALVASLAFSSVSLKRLRSGFLLRGGDSHAA